MTASKLKNKKNTNRVDRQKNKKLIALEFIVLAVHSLFYIIICTLYYFVEVPHEKQYYISLVIITLSYLIGGLIVGKTMKSNGLVYGLLYNLPSITITVISSLAINSFSFDHRFFLSFLLMLIMSSLGGILAVNSKHKKRIKR